MLLGAKSANQYGMLSHGQMSAAVAVPPTHQCKGMGDVFDVNLLRSGVEHVEDATLEGLNPTIKFGHGESS
jgi:hypothetical protein